MSSQNAFPGQNSGRPPVRPTTQTSGAQPSWVNPQAQPVGRPQQQSSGTGWPPREQPAPNYSDYGQPGFAGQQPQQPPAYGQWSGEPQSAGNLGYRGAPQDGSAGGQQDPYAPRFEPYVPPSRPNFSPSSQQRPQSPAPVYAQPGHGQQWPAREADPRGFDPGSFGGAQSYPAQQPAHPAQSFGQQQYHENELSAADWAGPHDSFGQDRYQQHQHGDPNLGFGQAEGGELEPAFNDEEYEYEDDEPAPRGRRPLMIVAALVGAIVIGGGMAYGYKKFTGSGAPEGDPPVVKSDDMAAKTKPADAGGKQFPYSDTKIMGRLGDGTGAAAADASASSNDGSSSGTADNSSTQDADGTRKVSTLVVGRDGSIMSPATPTQDQDQPQSPPQGGPAVPGTALVDAFGQQGGGGSALASDADQPRSQSADDSAPSAPLKKSKSAKITTINSADADDAAAPPKKKFKKVARLESPVETGTVDDTAPATPHNGTGFVAVLASIPHSSSSRIDALKRFADMQQKYSAALSGKTPDIASANLAKGAYDRLVVGPPGSREQASNVCTQLKAEGYASCWVTAY